MRRSLFGVLIGTLLVLAIATGRSLSEPAAVGQPAYGAYPSSAALTSHATTASDGTQVVTVIDTIGRVMAVYHVDKSNGEIALKSVRNLTWDLQMLEFNSRAPLPQDVRGMRGELQR